MKINEYKKVAKLCDELLTYLLARLYIQVNVDVKMTATEAIVTLKVKELSDADAETIISAMKCTRNPSIEEYGWELLGGSESSNELELVGMCFNDCQYVKESDYSTITLSRVL